MSLVHGAGGVEETGLKSGSSVSKDDDRTGVDVRSEVGGNSGRKSEKRESIDA